MIQFDMFGKSILPISENLCLLEGITPQSCMVLGKIRDALTFKDELILFASVDGKLVIQDSIRGEIWTLDIFSLLMNYQNQREAPTQK